MPTKETHPPRFMTEPRTSAWVCAQMGISRATLSRLKALGAAPPHWEFGGREWYEEADVFAWLKTLRHEPRATPEETLEVLARKPGQIRTGTPQQPNPFRRKAS